MKAVSKPYSYLAFLGLVFAAYFATAELGLRVGAVATFATLVWAPTGIALTALLLGGMRLWPAITAAAFLVNFLKGASFPVALGIAAGNTFEAVLAAHMLRKLKSFHFTLDRIKDVFALICLGAIVSTLISASIGVTSLWLSGKLQSAQFGFTWVTWWLGDIMGDLVAAPFLLVFGASIRPQVRGWRLVEFFSLMTVIAFLCHATFDAKYNPEGYLKAYFMFPIMLWAALRFKQYGATLLALLISIFALYGIVHGQGPFSRLPLSQGLLQLQMFLATVVTTGLLLASVMSEREHANRLQKLLSEISSTLNASLDYETTLSQITKLLVPSLADGCFVDIVEENVIQRLVTLHHDPQKEAHMRELRRLYPPSLDSRQPIAQAIRTNEPYLLTEVDPSIIASHTVDSVHSDLIQKIGIQSHIAAPLIIRNKTIGVLGLLITSRARRYNSEDLPLILEVARRAATAIENARLYQTAHRAIQLRDDFISLASHELQTPLTSLKLQLQMGKRLPYQKVFTLFERADNQVDRLSKLVDNMLDITRIAMNKLPLEPQEVDLTALTREAIERVTHQLSSTGTEADVKFEGKQPLVGYWDKYRVEQIVINLLTNAAKYGAGKPIEVTVTRDRGNAKLRVKDSGIGIAKEDQERIFQRFERAANGSGISGLGLGLYISKQIVEAHHGSITVESQPRQGSTFEVTLALHPSRSNS